MKQSFFQGLAKVNKAVLPSFTKQGLDLAKAKKWQLALVGYRYYVTCQALG
ncbi:SsrA-binding protein [Aureicoccus marinus]|uniref:SsrA-binding protein n=1 Tax=Aureicoccus marinus TaxID=754435 RepID=A0A2S7T3S3_9FLAO|nr:SsrA-binding protein [Aureicoccus marinus]PQJ14572.1 SsrA-binding protein [Aureicoccus marinus]